VTNEESPRDRRDLFDDWAKTYDSSVRDDAFPLEGYQRVLGTIVDIAAAGHGMGVLDLGVGTGNLAKRFLELDCRVWGVDFSAEMLVAAGAKLPGARLVQADLRGEWTSELPRDFDRIVSGYVFHEFDLSRKVDLLARAIDECLAPDGRIVIGDVAFPTVAAREQARERWRSLWDETEHYWAADEAREACAHVGIGLEYRQVSSCGGVFVIRRQ
jgi:putative AdoMet-dependent methyltransferase